ncbi:MAG TPA: hypothetical protein VEW92_10325 [Nitrososphaeraceae archaeon]|nr:hypothetical protein [Nitrososphaeraceae archaeon]
MPILLIPQRPITRRVFSSPTTNEEGLVGWNVGGSSEVAVSSLTTMAQCFDNPPFHIP